MRKLIRVLALLVFLVGMLQCSSAKTNQPEPSPTTGFLEHIDHGCAGSEDPFDQPEELAQLVDYTASGDTLVLRL